jgi:hypothetical protein
VDGVDDLGVVDALEVDRGDARLLVSELALDDDQRDAFAGHLEGVGVAQLVRSEAAAHAGSGGRSTQVGTRLAAPAADENPVHAGPNCQQQASQK